MDAARAAQWKREAETVAEVLANSPQIDKALRVDRGEFQRRLAAVQAALAQDDLDVGIVYSDEHYNGDVPYLGGNTNITVEPVAGAVGPGGFHLMAGLEGGYVAEQLAPRSGCRVHKVEMLKLADEDYPVEAVPVEAVLDMAAGGKRPRRIGILSPLEVLPAAFYLWLRDYAGGEENLVNAQELYYRIRYEKSDVEMQLIRHASLIADAMIEGMLRVMKPGMLETQVAAWGYLIGRELGAEEMGWDVMVTANVANRTLIGKALNRPIRPGDYVHVGVAPKCDGLNSCERVSVIMCEDPDEVTPEQRFWFDFIEGAFRVGLEAYEKVAREGLPACRQEEAVVAYFKSRSAEVSERVGRPVDLVRQKPYTGTHNAGYTECQEFFGAITLDFDQPLGRQIVTMLDMAVRGVGSKWDDVVIPDLDFILVEKTLGKFGLEVEVLNRLPVNVQHLVGAGG